MAAGCRRRLGSGGADQTTVVGGGVRLCPTVGDKLFGNEGVHHFLLMIR